MKITPSLVLLFALMLLFTSCDKDDPDIIEEPELITSVTYTLTPDSGGAPILLSFNDADGDGGNAPVIVGGILVANETYSGSLDLKNTSITPAESITAEIQEEAADHQFFFQTTISTLAIAYNDEDANGNPIGLSSTLSSGEVASGTLTIILRHEPNKTAVDVSNGSIANAGGETDIEVTFPLDVQ